MSKAAIKSMKLYSRVDRIFNDLRAAGYGPDDPLSVDVLSRFDQYHYFGTDAVDEAIDEAGITADSKVLDIGSGIGGPARYLAAITGCSVTAIELQGDLDDVARQLTRRCNLDGQIDHRCADVLAAPLEVNHYDAIVSWLCFYHIPDRAGLLGQCMNALKPGGVLFAEDLFKHSELDALEMSQMSSMLFAQYLPYRETYVQDLADAGFAGISFLDMTEAWAPFVNQRRDDYAANFDRNTYVHGAEVVAAMEDFYGVVAGLFNGGSLGGTQVVARKPG